MGAAIDRAATGATLAAASQAEPPASEGDGPAVVSAAAATPSESERRLDGVASGRLAAPILDDTADIPEALSTALTRRAELMLLVARERDQTQQAKLDRVRSEFDNAQQVRSEQLREMNSLRDMAMEQIKKDDEILKKFIAMI